MKKIIKYVTVEHSSGRVRSAKVTEFYAPDIEKMFANAEREIEGYIGFNLRKLDNKLDERINSFCDLLNNQDIELSYCLNPMLHERFSRLLMMDSKGVRNRRV